MSAHVHTCMDNTTVVLHGAEGMIPIPHKPGTFICYKCGNAVTFN